MKLKKSHAYGLLRLQGELSDTLAFWRKQTAECRRIMAERAMDRLDIVKANEHLSSVVQQQVKELAELRAACRCCMTCAYSRQNTTDATAQCPPGGELCEPANGFPKWTPRKAPVVTG